MRANEKKKVDEDNLKNKEKERNQSFYDKLLYILRYRPFTGKQLISIFEALEIEDHELFSPSFYSDRNRQTMWKKQPINKI